MTGDSGPCLQTLLSMRKSDKEVVDVPEKSFDSPLRPNQRVTEEEAAFQGTILSMERSAGRLNRRSFMSAVAAASAAAAVAGTLGYSREAQAQSTAPSLTDVLNFALNLEYLEANFYIAASGAAPLSAADLGSSPGTVTSVPTGLSSVLDATTLAVATALAQDERNHIEQLRAAITSLGGTPISQPTIDLVGSTGVPIQSVEAFLVLSRIFTTVGNAAYAGAAQYLISNTTVLTQAAQILGAEAQHLGAINYLCAANGIPPALGFGPVTIGGIDGSDYPAGAGVNGAANTYFDVTPVSTTSGPAFGPARTTAQILGIVYLATLDASNPPSTGITSGGFFPVGFNGNIKST